MQVAERVAGLAVAHAAAVGAVAGGACVEVERLRRGPGRAVAGGGSGTGSSAGRRSCRRRPSASRGRRRPRPSRAPSSGSGRPFIDRVMQPLTRSASDSRAATGQRLRILRRDARPAPSPWSIRAGVEVAVLAGEVVAGEAHRRVRDLRPDQRVGLGDQPPAVVRPPRRVVDPACRHHRRGRRSDGRAARSLGCSRRPSAMPCPRPLAPILLSFDEPRRHAACATTACRPRRRRGAGCWSSPAARWRARSSRSRR